MPFKTKIGRSPDCLSATGVVATTAGCLRTPGSQVHPALSDRAPVLRVLLDPIVSCLMVVTAVVVGRLTLGDVDPRTAVVLCWAVVPAADVVLFVMAWRVCRLLDVRDPSRRFWQAATTAGVVFTLGDTYQLLMTLGDPAVVTLAPSGLQSISAIGGAAVLVGVTLTHPSGIGSRQARTRFFLDAATIMTAAGVVAWCLLTRPSAAGADPNAFLTALIGSGVLLVGVFTAVKLGLGGSSPMGPAAALPMVVAAALQGIANIVVPVDTSPSRLPLHLALTVTPALLFAMGGRIQEVRERSRPAGTRKVITRRRYSFLPYAATVLTFGIFAGVLHNGPALSAWGALAGLVVIVGLVIVRQILALRENGDLLDRLDDSINEITRRERRLDLLLQHSSDITSVLDRNGRFTYVNPALQRILGLQPGEVLGRRMVDFLHPADRAGIAAQLRDLAAEPGAVVTFQSRYRNADDAWRWLEVTATNLTTEPGIDGVVANARDVTEARELQERLLHQATHDALTGLANRRLFATRMHELRHTGAAVLLIDLDGFKQINDTYGHSAGDHVLLRVTECLTVAAGPADLVARFGGDEFAVLVASGDELDARRVATRFLDALTEPVEIAGQSLTIRASVGVVAGDAADAEGLLHAADMQMYAEKRRTAAR